MAGRNWTIYSYLGGPLEPISSGFRPYSSKPVGCTLTMVNELIDPVAKCWKIDVLESLFSSEEVSLIRTIPLSTRNPPDYLLWHHERHGRFMVRSACHVARNWRNPRKKGHRPRLVMEPKFGRTCGMHRCHRKSKSAYGDLQMNWFLLGPI